MLYLNVCAGKKVELTNLAIGRSNWAGKKEAILMEHDTAEPKRKLVGKELENFLRIKKRLMEIQQEDARLRDELDAMGLKFERRWWRGPLGKPLNFEAD